MTITDYLLDIVKLNLICNTNADGSTIEQVKINDDQYSIDEIINAMAAVPDDEHKLAKALDLQITDVNAIGNTLAFNCEVN